MAIGAMIGMGIGSAGLASSPTGAQFVNVPPSVRQAEMGGSVVGGRDVLRAWSNPAALAELERRGEIGINGSSMFAGEQSTFGFGAGRMVTPGWKVGALLSSYSLSIPEVDVSGRTVGANLERGVLAAGVATAFSLGFGRVGMTVKSINDNVLGDRASAIAGDAGLSTVWESFSAAVAYRNLGGNLRSGVSGGPAEALPSEFRGRIAFTHRPLGITATVEHARVAGVSGRTLLGAEWWPARLFAVRAGVADVGAVSERYTAGVSASWSGLGLGYARAAHPIGLTHVVSLSFAFGPSALELAAARAAARARREAEMPGEAPVAVLAPAPIPAAAKPNVAVADLTPQNVSAGDAAVVTDLLRNEFIKSRAFNVVERSNMERILAEHAFQQSGCTTDECAIKLGKLLNVQRMVMGSFGRLLSTYIVSVRVVDVQSGAILFSETAKGKSEDELSNRLAEMSARVIRQTR